jgi:tRNA A37 threonylcarbamoyladenosine dehydratase
VDGDVVNPSNVNRQLMATTRTVGRPKVEALRERLLDINPEADITPIQAVYNKESAPEFHLEQYDYIIDAIDSLKDKAALIVEASALPGTLFSSMGAACKADPTRIKVAEFWEVRGCPLGAALRKKLRKEKTLPAKPFLCVYDDEVLPNLGDSSLADNEGNSAKAVINGTLAHITGIFGFTLAGLVIRDMLDRPRG